MRIVYGHGYETGCGCGHGHEHMEVLAVGGCPGSMLWGGGTGWISPWGPCCLISVAVFIMNLLGAVLLGTGVRRLFVGVGSYFHLPRHIFILDSVLTDSLI